MDNQLQIFKNPAFGEIRTITDENNDPWFVGRDVATVLGYRDSVNALKSHVEEEDKARWQITTQFGDKPATFINESGLYSLIISSKLPQARQFRHWVTSEVLPALRKHGAYMTEASLERGLTDPDYLIKLANTMKAERQHRYEMEARAKEQQQIILSQQSEIKALDMQVGTLQKSVNDMKEKVSYLDLILASNSSLTTTQIAQDYGISAINLNKRLHKMGIQHKVNDQWILMIKYQGKGYIDSHTITINTPKGDTIVKMQTVWTPQGRMFIYNKLKEEGLVPIMEKN